MLAGQVCKMSILIDFLSTFLPKKWFILVNILKFCRLMTLLFVCKLILISLVMSLAMLNIFYLESNLLVSLVSYPALCLSVCRSPKAGAGCGNLRQLLCRGLFPLADKETWTTSWLGRSGGYEENFKMKFEQKIRNFFVFREPMNLLWLL